MTTQKVRDRITQIALRRNIFFPSAEIYTPAGGFYDFGPVGALIKKRIEKLWREYFIKRHNFLEVETSIVVPEVVVKASGHLDHFTDPIVTCRKCGNKFRIDMLLEEQGIPAEGKSIDEINEIMQEAKVICPTCGGDMSETGFFNLMFQTNIGPIDGHPGYARPETAQGIFLAFPRIFKNYGRLPVGIAQIGKSLRNEISPRQGMIRLREFTQMEIEYFFDPEKPEIENFEGMANKKIIIFTHEDQREEREASTMGCKDSVLNGIVPNEIMAFFMAATFEFYKMCGIPERGMRFRHLLPNETPHYSGGNFDLQVLTSYGWIETVGLAYRTDYDLRSHSKMSGKDLSVVVDGKRFIPHVVEPSFGVDRLFWCILEHTYKEGKERGWEWFDLPQIIAPYDAAVLPLMKKDGLAEKAKEIFEFLKKDIDVYYDESGSIGKRYARSDEVGVKWAITVDYETLKDSTVTIRDRNTTEQERVKIEELTRKLR